ncbi:MAG TPA: hypothetical protein VMS98_11110 [Thermoanaerobaculia bacterium]|nr:hypothetical protein [Thermoanaerobaculia bacterium]
MRKMCLTLALVLVLVTPVFAGTKFQKFAPLPADDVKIEHLPADSDLGARVIQQYLDLRRQDRVRASALTGIRTARGFIIPVAGSAAGGGGTFFRSDVTLVNADSSSSQDILAVWIARGVATTTPPTTRITLAADATRIFRDFVANTLQQSGIGSVFFLPVIGTQIDPNAAIDGFSRIFTPQPGSAGTVSQEFLPVDPGDFPPFQAAAALGLKHDAAFRTNFFIVNAQTTPLTVNFLYLGTNGSSQPRTVVVPPLSLHFDSIPANENYGDLAIVFVVNDPNATWIAGASSTDNITGDGWVSLFSAFLSPSELGGLGF